MIRDATWRVAADEAGGRLDRLVQRHFPNVPRTMVLAAIARDAVQVNGRTAAKGGKLRAGDTVAIRELWERVDIRVQPEPDAPLAVVCEDEHLLALDKPAGMPTHPLEPWETGTLANALVGHRPALATVGSDPLFPALAHRLDRETSGLVLAAKAAAVHEQLRAMFRGREMEKVYFALVHGRVEGGDTLIDELGHDPRHPGHMLVLRGAALGRAERPMRAVTRFRPAQVFAAHTLLEVTIETGVTHQIRCQLAAAGWPIVGDRTYGRGAADAALLPDRHFLHAARLGFLHPVTGAATQIQAPLPPELERVLAIVDA